MLDLDRGVTKRKHPNGFVVAMYKDVPGQFMDVNGDPLDEELARQAGFDTETLSKERMKNEKMQEARQQIEKEFESQSEEIERLLDAKTEKYHVRHVGGGRYGIYDDAGNRLTQKPMTRDEADNFVARLDLPTGRGDNAERSDGEAQAPDGQQEAAQSTARVG